MKKLTTKEFIEKAKLVHGEKYDYSSLNYINKRTKVKIMCAIHGFFEQEANTHLSGSGCKYCGKNKMTYNKSNQEEIINKCNLIHNNKYDYSLLKYVNNKTNIIVICPEHGEFEQEANSHIQGSGCPKCFSNRLIRKLSSNNEDFIKKAKNKHGDKYNYSLINYINNKTKINIFCPKHGEFEQIPNNHLRGQGCPICSESKGEREIKHYLENKKVKFIPQYKFPDCKYKRLLPFDFYLPDYNICIEFNGEQHYKPVKYFGGDNSFKLIKKRDNIKIKYCEDNNIQLIIIKHHENLENCLRFFLQ